MTNESISCSDSPPLQLNSLQPQIFKSIIKTYINCVFAMRLLTWVPLPGIVDAPCFYSSPEETKTHEYGLPYAIVCSEVMHNISSSQLQFPGLML